MYNSNIMKISGVFTAGAYGIQIPTQKYAHEYFDDIDTRCAHPDQSGFVQPRHSTFYSIGTSDANHAYEVATSDGSDDQTNLLLGGFEDGNTGAAALKDALTGCIPRGCLPKFPLTAFRKSKSSDPHELPSPKVKRVEIAEYFFKHNTWIQSLEKLTKVSPSFSHACDVRQIVTQREKQFGSLLWDVHVDPDVERQEIDDRWYKALIAAAAHGEIFPNEGDSSYQGPPWPLMWSLEQIDMTSLKECIMDELDELRRVQSKGSDSKKYN